MRVKTKLQKFSLINSATELFINKGFSNVSMDAIAAHANTTKSTLYNYFKSKEELFKNVLMNADKGWMLDLSSAIKNEQLPVQERLKNWGFEYLKFILSPEIGALNRLMISEAPNYPKLALFYYENGPKKVLGMLTEALADATKKQEINVPDPATAVTQFINLCHAHLLGAQLWINYHAKPDEITLAVEHAVHIFMKIYGIKNR